MFRETRVVPYSSDLMYQVVADVEHYPEFLPGVLDLKIKSRSAAHVLAEMVVGFKNFRESYTSHTALYPEGRRIDVAQTEGPLRKMESHWQFAPEGKGCRVDFTVDFEFKSKLLGAVANTAFEKGLHKMIDAFVARAKALAAADE